MIQARVKALLIEDNPGDARLVKELLREVPEGRIEVTWVEGISDAESHVGAEGVDVVLLDLGLAECQGLDTLVAFNTAYRGVPVVVLTGNSDVECAIASVHKGAQDYLLKDQLNPVHLARSIYYAIERHAMRSRIEHLNSVLRSIRDVNKLITRVTDRSRLIQQVCDLLVETRGWPGAWIVLLDEDGAMIGGASSGDFEAYADLIARLEAGQWPACMSEGMARPETLVISDTVEQCGDCPVASSHRGRGALGRRLEMGDTLYGFMAIAVPREFVASDEELGLFEEVVDDVALGLHQMALRDERDRMRAQLAQSDRMATVGMLAAGVAHEINNPLTYMLYHTDAIREELPEVGEALKEAWAALDDVLGEEGARARLGRRRELDDDSGLDELLESAKWAMDGAERVGHIVRDLKIFSRVEEEQPELVQLSDVVESALNMATNEVKYRARLVRRVEEVPLVLANAGRLSQVFLNLVINAAQAIDEGDAEHNEIVVQTFVESGEACVEIRDTGKGIAAEHLQRLFEPFFTTKPKGVGTGLGLSICKSIVTVHDGRIDVESEVGQGTRFVVRLPCQVKPPVAVDGQRTTKMTLTPSSRRGRILVVDDEEQVRVVIDRILSRDHDLVLAASGYAARELLEEDRRFDAILCDMMMPEVSGIDLYEWLLDRAPELVDRVVFMTGGVFTPRVVEFKSRTSNPIVNKPFNAKVLRLLLREVVASAPED